jgi:hypothetical protein
MTTLVLEKEPVIKAVIIKKEKLEVTLDDGRGLLIPLQWYPRLLNGSRKERANWRLLGDGYAIEWPDLDEHIGVEGLLAGRPSGESRKSLQRWLAARRKAADD